MTKRDDELPLFRPRFGSRRMPPDDRGLGPSVLSRLSSSLGRRHAPARRRARFAIAPAVASSRRVVIKARYVKLSPHGKLAAALHLRYIQRDGVERDGRPGILYGPAGPVRAETFEAPRLGEEHQFRFIVSPEEAGDLDLSAYVRSLMARVERDVRRPLEWAAVNHYNTDHPHAHIVVRGVDRTGHPLRFDREYIARGMRERAQELATRELGPRTVDEVQRAHEREVTQERFTSLDRALARRICDGRVDRADLVGAARRQPKEMLLLARLQYLERMRLAERVAPDAWVLTPNWEGTLRALGDRVDILRQMHAVVRGDPARYQVLTPGEPLPGGDRGPSRVVVGRIRGRVLDELRGTLCAVVETPEGGAYRVPLDRRAGESVRTGDLVALRTVPRPRWCPEDAEIEQMANNAGGRCVVPADGQNGERSDLSRRLRQLERLGLAQREADGSWRVVTPLRAALDRLDRERPEFRLLLRTEPRPLDQQVQARAPVWLDHLDPSTLAPYGLGAELRPALERRAETLRSWGLTPGDPKRFSKLRELERLAVGEAAAQAAGVAFVARTPDGFRGRLSEAPGAPHYAVVCDGTRLVAMPMTRSLRQQLGQVVSLTYDGKVQAVTFTPDRGR